MRNTAIVACMASAVSMEADAARIYFSGTLDRVVQIGDVVDVNAGDTIEGYFEFEDAEGTLVVDDYIKAKSGPYAEFTSDFEIDLFLNVGGDTVLIESAPGDIFSDARRNLPQPFYPGGELTVGPPTGISLTPGGAELTSVVFESIDVSGLAGFSIPEADPADSTTVIPFDADDILPPPGSAFDLSLRFQTDNGSALIEANSLDFRVAAVSSSVPFLFAAGAAVTALTRFGRRRSSG